MISNKNNNIIISRRTFLIGIGKLFLFFLVFIRMFYLQYIKGDKYNTLSDKNRISLVLVKPERGKIFDIHNNALAINKTVFRLLINKSYNKNYKQDLAIVINLLGLNEDYDSIYKKVKNSDSRTPIVILDQITWNQISIIEENKYQLPSVFIDNTNIRYYNISSPISHIIGYMGQVNEKEAQILNINNKDLYIGKSGVEKFYEEDLRGVFGYKQMEVNAFGKYVREIASVEALPGSDLQLNIDSELQQSIMPYLIETGCSSIVMDCDTGNILIFAVTPTFEINNFNKLSHSYWDSLVNDDYKPLINKAIQNIYPAGSVFKLITVLAALEQNISPTMVVNCNGGSMLKDRFHCHSKTGHGHIDMISAVQYSCNTYMYNLAKIIGGDNIINMARKFGFGAKTNIDLPNEVQGIVYDKQWKKRVLKQNWTIGDTFNISIGQGFISVTPIQLLRFVNTIATSGRLYTPRVAKSSPQYTTVDIKQKNFDIIKEGMHRVVNTPGGTAYYSRILNSQYQMAGKTGTSQVIAKLNKNDDLSRQSVAWKKRNHGIFIGFAPFDKPKYSIVVFADHGGGGGKAAAPIASKIMKEVLEKYT